MQACASPFGAGDAEGAGGTGGAEGGLFERAKSPNFCFHRKLQVQKENFTCKKNLKCLRPSQKSIFTLESYTALFPT